MGIRLGDNQYGKAETHLVRIAKDGPDGAHEIRDLTVSVALAGDFAASHLTGDNRSIVATDSQKNTVFAFAQEGPLGEAEEFALRLARHFVAEYPSVARARVAVAEQGWDRILAGGRPHPHAFVRRGDETRLATATCSAEGAWLVSGISDLVVLKSAGSEFRGFIRDRYTTLPETSDRILATALLARWRHAGPESDWHASYAETRAILLETFATKHSLALQQTLYAMGEAVLRARPEVAEIRLSMPNKHHFEVDLRPFGLDNRSEVFYAADRPYGLIEGTVLREGAPEAGLAWS
jgi:urate oxidase